MLYLVLPAYNEADAIGILLDRIAEVRKRLDEPLSIIVVDDGSTDSTAEVVQSKGYEFVEVVPHPQNVGLGAAVKTGLKWALQRAKDKDFIALMDADNTHDPYLLLPMLKLAQQGADVVVASRYQRGGKEVGLSFHRHLFSKVVNIAYQLLFGVPGIRDYTCGYRLYRAKRLHELRSLWGERFLEAAGFTVMAELLLKLNALGNIKGAEVPLVLRYDLKGGRSKMKVLKTIMQHLSLMLRALFFRKVRPAS